MLQSQLGGLQLLSSFPSAAVRGLDPITGIRVANLTPAAFAGVQCARITLAPFYQLNFVSLESGNFYEKHSVRGTVI